jgi:hypothetical protein
MSRASQFRELLGRVRDVHWSLMATDCCLKLVEVRPDWTTACAIRQVLFIRQYAVWPRGFQNLRGHRVIVVARRN